MLIDLLCPDTFFDIWLIVTESIMCLCCVDACVMRGLCIEICLPRQVGIRRNIYTKAYME